MIMVIVYLSMETKKPIVLAILDGWGRSKNKLGNAFIQANTPVLDAIDQRYKATLLQASGLAVGLTFGEVGNSEVGHLNIGAGRIVQQYLSRINRAIDDKTFFQNPALIASFDHITTTGGRLHLIGLLSSGTVHASFDHLVALLDLASQHGVSPILHLFFDGKDAGMQDGAELYQKLQTEIVRRSAQAVCATVIGRKHAMDRDNNWQWTQETYDLIVSAKGEVVDDISVAVHWQYANGLNDQTITPLVLASAKYDGMHDNDAVFFFNFREDAIRQLSLAFIQSDFDRFPRKEWKDLFIGTMTEYFKDHSQNIAFMPPLITDGLAETLSKNDKKQFHITETEKYAHVTYFFNGLRDDSYPGEDDALIESYKDHEKNPQMRSQEIADRVIEELQKNIYDFVVLNFPNADIIAHTGNFQATKESIEVLDRAIGTLQTAIVGIGGILIITGDHGNAESLITGGSGERETKHNDSPVPFYIVADDFVRGASGTLNLEIGGILADVAPTILALMNITQPPEMTGGSLLTILE